MRSLEEYEVYDDKGIFTESQIPAFEKKKDMVFGEIETFCPDYLGSHYTFYVVTIKGVI